MSAPGALPPPRPSVRRSGSAGSCGAQADCRCACGNLLARLVSGGVELKCRRCKRTQVVPLDLERS